MNEFYFYAELHGVKWYKCRRCQAAARDVIPAVCPICKGQGKLLTVDTFIKNAETLKSIKDITGISKPA